MDRNLSLRLGKAWGWRAKSALSPVFQKMKMKMKDRNIHDTDYQKWLDTTQQDFPWEENEIEKLEPLDTSELIKSLEKLQKLIKKGKEKK
tara:strand:+ start:68 stop:337 length:270 start_codon:yes stop_codon:yes gene_type:complete